MGDGAKAIGSSGMSAMKHIASPSSSGFLPNANLVEISTEVCQQVGGIYTLIHSKIPAMMRRWGRRYCLVGPYNPAAAAAEFEQGSMDDIFGQAARTMRGRGYDVHYGRWLVTGRPNVILMNTQSVMHKLGEIKYFFWEHHHISIPDDEEVNFTLAFGHMVREFLWTLLHQTQPHPAVIAHFHEWLGAAAIPDLRRDRAPLGMVFTTHATVLGRYLAMADGGFYDHLPHFDWQKDARRFNIEARVRLERAASHGAHVFTTVSDVTGNECRCLLGREPDFILPNGLSIERFSAAHESENLHRVCKEMIHKAVMGHFFPSYSFNLDRTLYLFTSGRYEYRNKGFDIVLESLARLNHRLKQMRSDVTVVLFIISKRPCRSINADVLNNKAVMEELRRTCEVIKDRLGDRLFQAAAMGAMPDLNELVDEYWRLRLRRTMQAWRTDRLPYVVTHDLWDNGRDDVLNQLRASRLLNAQGDPVKVIYHPDFITPSNPLFGMEYDQFVQGCHMGLFPSYYEPWGYTPLECIARSIPAVTSDFAGFGDYITKHYPDCEKNGVFVIHRRNHSDSEAAEEMLNYLLGFIKMDLRERIAMRFRSQTMAEGFDWHHLARRYDDAHVLALSRSGS